MKSVAAADSPVAPVASPETVLASAVAMRERLAQLEPQTNLDRTVPAETIQAFKDAGFFRLLQPPRYGGFDADYDLCTQVIEELTQGCASSAWVYSVVVLHHLFLSAWPLEVQDEVWGEDRDVLISSSLAPRPIEKVDGGYRLTGDWSFSSGCDHARWAMIGGAPPGAPPVLMLVPMSEILVVDDWRTLGLRGTGSKTLRMEGVFVPERRAIPLQRLSSGSREPRPGMSRTFWDTAPPGMFGVYNFSTVILGLARRAVELTTEMLRTPGSWGAQLSDVDSYRMLLAEATSITSVARFQIHGGARQHVANIRAGQTYEAKNVSAVSRDVAVMTRQMRNAVVSLSDISGRWVYDRHPLQQIVRDTLTGSTHRSANWEAMVLPSVAHVLPKSGGPA